MYELHSTCCAVAQAQHTQHTSQQRKPRFDLSEILPALNFHLHHLPFMITCAKFGYKPSTENSPHIRDQLTIDVKNINLQIKNIKKHVLSLL